VAVVAIFHPLLTSSSRRDWTGIVMHDTTATDVYLWLDLATVR